MDSVARARKYSAWIDALAKVIREYAPLERVVYLHANNQPSLDDLNNHLTDILPNDVRTITVTPSVGTHIGPGAIGLRASSARAGVNNPKTKLCSVSSSR